MYTDESKLLTSLDSVKQEYLRATRINGPFNSAHEAYAVILEELDELWEEVKKKHRDRDYSNMYMEACQVSAMALRFMVDICVDEI